MSKEDPNVTVARFSFKQAIVVAAITGATTLGGTLLTMNFRSGGSKSVNSTNVNSDRLVACAEENKQMQADLSRAITFSSLADISNSYFRSDASGEEVKNSIRGLVNSASQNEEDTKHFMHKLFRLKKLMLVNGGNINVRVSTANPEACRLIQDLLQGIEFYKGSLDGNNESTMEAVIKFQNHLNQYSPGYFEEANQGIVGKKTFNAILDWYERN